MATKPSIKVLTATSPQVLNVIRNQATQNYKDYVPVATPDAESIKQIGAIIMDYPALRNEFISSLVNRIAKVIVTSKLYTNPWAMFKKGVIELGETVEDIFVNIAKPFQFDPEVAETEVFKREIPDIHAAFYTMNYQKFYKTTVSNDQLRTAFLSWDGITDLIAKIVESMYTGANYDEFQVTKYMLARWLLDGKIAGIETKAVTEENMKSVVSTIKAASNSLEFMTDKYNVAGVLTHALKEDQYIILNSKFDAIMDVEVLASAFNMDKAQFMGQRVLVDGFGDIDNKRLAILFANDSTYVALTAEELELLNTIPAVLVDKDFFMIFDNMLQMTENYNGQGIYWNYFYHTWKTFACSPFANAIAFIPASQSVDSVTISPKTATVSAGSDIQLSVEVEAENLAPKAVNWEITSEGNIATVNNSGYVSTKAGETGTVVVKATSVFDSTKSDTCTITVS